MDLAMETRRDGDDVRLVLAGELDMDTAPDLAAQLTALAEDGGREVVVDLTALDFMDSSGLSVLLQTHHALAARGGGVVLVGANQYILQTLDITGLTDVFTVRAVDPVEATAEDSPAG